MPGNAQQNISKTIQIKHSKTGAKAYATFALKTGKLEKYFASLFSGNFKAHTIQVGDKLLPLESGSLIFSSPFFLSDNIPSRTHLQPRNQWGLVHC